jgi:hypothetical protein
MPTLTVSNGFVKTLGGLGKVHDFEKLSEKRVTKCTRQVLRETYGTPAVHVSCSANFGSSNSTGSCSIDGRKFNYFISRS